jgi:hypothetical protein
MDHQDQVIRAVAVGPLKSLAEFNAWQSNYWNLKRERLEQACEHPDVIEEALENMDCQRVKLGALGIRIPFEKEEYLYDPVEQVVRTRQAHAKRFFLAGRKARKHDELTAYIERIVRVCPQITSPELVKRDPGGGPSRLR